MKIEMMAIKLLKPYEKNPRLNAKAIPQVMKSLTEFGWRQPIVVDKDLVVIVGHTRLAAAKQMKLKQVPVHVADLTEAQVKAYRITDNRSHDRSEWDMPLLSGELDAIFDMDVKFDLEFMDFSLEDLNPEEDTSANPDYSLIEGEDDTIIDKLKNGQVKAIQIEFDIDKYDEAYQLVKYWRKEKANVGDMVIEALKQAKDIP